MHLIRFKSRNQSAKTFHCFFPLLWALALIRTFSPNTFLKCVSLLDKATSLQGHRSNPSISRGQKRQVMGRRCTGISEYQSQTGSDKNQNRVARFCFDATNLWFSLGAALLWVRLLLRVIFIPLEIKNENLNQTGFINSWTLTGSYWYWCHYLVLVNLAGIWTHDLSMRPLFYYELQ